MKSKVYIVCEPYHRIGMERVPTVDLTPAAEYGEPIILMSKSSAPMNVEATIATLREKLRDFSDNDWLVPIGDPALMCQAAMVAAAINNGRVGLLKWDRQNSRYIPITVEIK